MNHSQLDRYSFWWSEVRLIIAAIALFLGGIPPIYKLVGYSASSYGLISNLLSLCWLVSGVASAYLLYRWSKDKQLFGHKLTQDTTAFFISIVSGINLGLAGLLRRNIGMSISTNRIVFIIVGIAYLWSAYHLYNRFKSHGEKIF